MPNSEYIINHTGSEIDSAITLVGTHTASTSNPHSVTKAQVGLENVGNFKAVSTEASQGLSSEEQTNARANIGTGDIVTAISSSSTDAQYPSAKCVFDMVGNIEAALEALL